MLALCTTKVGGVHGQRDLACRGRDLYTRSLRELRLAVLDPLARLDDQTLAATLLLAMYEFTECPGQEVHGFQAHLGGGLNLLRLRGAAAHTAGLGHALLFGIRKSALFRSLDDRESSFLATQDWQSLPYVVLAKNAHDELCDVLEQIPGLLACIRVIKAETRLPAILSHTLEALQLAWRIEEGLAAWFDRFEASVSGPLMVPKLARIPSATDDPTLGKLYPVAFHFSHFAIGQAITLYWAGLVILYTFLSNAYRQLRRLVYAVAGLEEDMAPCTCGDRGGNDETIESEVQKEKKASPRNCVRHFRLNMLQPLQRRATPQVVADQVCQSVEYFLQEDMGILGGTLIFPPLLIVRNARLSWDGDTSRQSRQGMWINEMMQRIARKGNRMAVQVE
ncbi:hypothetical protein SEUCBS140593_010641 [Sporothrix eucalyptigena]|uniref:Uncharacterized protein n=1 Tax=Sporothrix eucalyptigena TaxID=1812306 RepID=A0ABP0D1V6_9PEZI